MSPDNLLLLSSIILLLPLLGFVIIIFFGKKLGDGISAAIGTGFLGIDFLLSIYVAFVKLTEYPDAGMLQWKFDWLMLGTRNISLGLGIDNLAVIMLIVVTLISLLVHIFSLEYMRGDRRFSRFYAYLGIFSFSMLGIVIANNFLNMYIFWELVGLSSYLLIGFWYEKDSAANASKKAFIANRVGDLGFLLGILIVFFTFGTMMFDDVYAGIASGIVPFDSGAWLTAAGILLFCGAIGKSAQFPLHVWLPDAMEGPTPVSALIHAATMVAAGVYLTARIFPMLTADALLFVAYIGAITAFIAATIAITQNDFKKVLAYSTISQLGYMVMAMGVGAFTSGFMHLITHAWFKAGLFLVSGSVIHAMHVSMHHAHNHDMEAQDIRNMGGLRKNLKITYITFLFCTLALSGVPFTSGFLSKDGILAGTLAFANLSGHWLIPLAGFAAAGMTAFYMFRLTIEAFHGKPKTDIASHTKENKMVVVGPLIILSFLSIFAFYSFNPFDASSGWFQQLTKAPLTVVPDEYQFDFFKPFGQEEGHILDEELIGKATNGGHEGMTADEENAIDEHGHAAVHKEHAGGAHSHGEHHGAHEFEVAMNEAHMPAMTASIIIAFSGIILAFLIYQLKLFKADNMAKLFAPAYKLSYNKWYFDEIYQASFINGTVGLAKVLSWFDNKVIDGIVNFSATLTRGISIVITRFDIHFIDGFVNLSAGMTGFFGAVFRKVQTGKIQAYLVFAVIGLLVIIFAVL